MYCQSNGSIKWKNISQYIVNIKMLDALSFHVGLTKYQVFIVNLMVTWSIITISSSIALFGGDSSVSLSALQILLCQGGPMIQLPH